MKFLANKWRKNKLYSEINSILTSRYRIQYRIRSQVAVVIWFGTFNVDDFYNVLWCPVHDTFDSLKMSFLICYFIFNDALAVSNALISSHFRIPYLHFCGERITRLSGEKDENQQQTQPTYGVSCGIRTRATLVVLPKPGLEKALARSPMRV